MKRKERKNVKTLDPSHTKTIIEREREEREKNGCCLSSSSLNLCERKKLDLERET